MKRINITEKLGIKLEYYQPNFKFKDKMNKDCSIRAISKLLGISWDDSFKLLYGVALDLGTTLNYIKCIENAIKEYGYEKIIGIPKYKYRLADVLYTEEYKTGKYLICLSNPPHAIAYIDGIAYDDNTTFDEILTSKVLCVYKCNNELKINQNKKKVFLGGTCNGSIWRDKLIPMLNIDYFNPVAKEWIDESDQKKLQEKEKCDLCLYVITPLLEEYADIKEAINNSYTSVKTIFCILKEDFNPVNNSTEQFDDHDMTYLHIVSRKIKRNGGIYATSLEEVANILNS